MCGNNSAQQAEQGQIGTNHLQIVKLRKASRCANNVPVFLQFPINFVHVSRKAFVKAVTLTSQMLQGQYTLQARCVYHCCTKFKDIGKPMILSTVRSERSNSVLDVVGKGLLFGLFVGASALSQASPVTAQAVYIDAASCSSGGASARHGSSRTGCNSEFTEYFGEAGGSAGSVLSTFVAPANFSGAVSIATPQLTGAKPAAASVAFAPPLVAPGPSAAISPVVTAPIAVVPQGVAPQQIVATAPATPAAPAVTPSTTGQPAVTATTPAGNTLPAPTVAVFAVPEPGTVALLLGGFIALIGIRRTRAASTK